MLVVYYVKRILFNICTMKVFNLNQILKNAILLGLWVECLTSHSDIDFWLS